MKITSIIKNCIVKGMFKYMSLIFFFGSFLVTAQTNLPFPFDSRKITDASRYYRNFVMPIKAFSKVGVTIAFSDAFDDSPTECRTSVFVTQKIEVAASSDLISIVFLGIIPKVSANLFGLDYKIDNKDKLFSKVKKT